MPQIRSILSLLILLSLLSLASFTFAQEKEKSRKTWGRSINISTNNGDSDNCADHVNISSDRAIEEARSEESRTLPNQALNVSASRNGGIHVRNWDKPEIMVKICKVAAAPTESAAQGLLQQIKMNVQGSRLSVDGPESVGGWKDDTTWSAVLLIYAPVGATLDLEANNGGISLRKVDGNIKARTRNGGVSLVESRGKLDAETTNGGISIKDCGGDVKAVVQNGGLSIELGETWSGAGLEARTQNGGLSIAVPKGMQSGVEVAMLGHGSISCRSDICGDGQRTWDDNGKMVRFGSGTTLIRASTVNGGTVIKERGRKMGKL